MRSFLWIGSILLFPLVAFADTIDHYMHIASNIPTMEMKADAEAQAWARSARNVLVITNESIAETLTEANAMAQTQGKPLYCLPNTETLNAEKLKALIEQAYQNTPQIQGDKDKMTVSQVAWMAVMQHYPCVKNTTAAATPTMQHDEG